MNRSTEVRSMIASIPNYPVSCDAKLCQNKSILHRYCFDLFDMASIQSKSVYKGLMVMHVIIGNLQNDDRFINDIINSYGAAVVTVFDCIAHKCSIQEKNKSMKQFIC